MAAIVWDDIGARLWETGVDHGVHYTPTAHGVYGGGVPWNGLVSVTQKPTGAEPNDQYADNIKYLTLYSQENFEATVEAFTYPEEFAECDGSVALGDGVYIGQQPRKAFGLCYRTLQGNDVDNQDYGYKLHIVYGAMASPSERGYETINDSPEAITFSWDLTTIPVPVPGHKPTAYVELDSVKVGAEKMAELEKILYGDDSSQARLPTPEELITILGVSNSYVSPRERARMEAEKLPQAQAAAAKAERMGMSSPTTNTRRVSRT